LYTILFIFYFIFSVKKNDSIITYIKGLNESGVKINALLLLIALSSSFCIGDATTSGGEVVGEKKEKMDDPLGSASVLLADFFLLLFLFALSLATWIRDWSKDVRRAIPGVMRLKNDNIY